MAMPRADIALVAAPVEGLGLLVYDHARALDADARGVAHAAVLALACLDDRHAAPGATRRRVARIVALSAGESWRRMAKAGECGNRRGVGSAGRTASYSRINGLRSPQILRRADDGVDRQRRSRAVISGVSRHARAGVCHSRATGAVYSAASGST